MTNEEIARELTNHNDRLKVAEKGVSNFRNFQESMNRKVGFVYGVTWIGGIFGMIALAVFSWVLSLVVPAAKIVIEDYYHNHPTAVYPLRQHSSAVTPPVQAKSGQTVSENPPF